MLIPASKVTIVDTWDTTGMRGTGSHDFVVDNVFVPAEESVGVLEKPPVQGLLYLYCRFWLSRWRCLGIARGALDSVWGYCGRKEMAPTRLLRDDTQTQGDRVDLGVGGSRAATSGTLDDLWAKANTGDKASRRAAYRLMMIHSHKIAKAISVLYDLAATSAIFTPIRSTARCAT